MSIKCRKIVKRGSEVSINTTPASPVVIVKTLLALLVPALFSANMRMS